MKAYKTLKNKKISAVRRWPPMRVNLVFKPARMRVYMEEKENGETHFYWRQGPLSLFQEPANQDSFDVRERFLRVRNRDEALTFLQSTGMFVHRRENPERGFTMLPELTMTEFRDWQRLIWRAQTESLASMFRELAAPGCNYSVAHPAPKLYFDFDPSESDAPSSQIRLFVDTTVEAIVNTVLLDEIEGRQLRVCALGECSKIFELKRRGKVYCGRPCARKANKQKIREAKKRNTN